MYVKNGGVYVTDDINELPFEHLHAADQVVLIYKNTNKNQWEHQTQTRTLVLENKISIDEKCLFYDFQEHEVIAEYKYDEEYLSEDDKNPTIVNEYARVKNDKDRSHFFRFKNGENFEMEDCVRYCNVSESHIQREIHNRLFGDKPFEQFSFLASSNKVVIDNNFYMFVPFKLTENSYLLILHSNHFEINNKIWDNDKNIFIIHRNERVYKMDLDSEKFFEKLTDIYTDYFEREVLKEFKEYLVDMNLNMQKYASLDTASRYLAIRKIKDHISPMISSNFETYSQLEEIFKPIHTDNGIEFFPDELSRYHRGTIVEYNGKILTSHIYDLTKEEKELLRVGKYIVQFFDNKHGIDPVTGQYYHNGVLNEKVLQNAYIDYEGIILEDMTDQNKYYIKMAKKYWVLADTWSSKDKEAVEDLKERKRVMDALDAAL